MNIIDEIKQEITEERLREGWVFELNNSNKFSTGDTEFERTLKLHYSQSKNKFCSDFKEVFNGDTISEGFMISDFDEARELVKIIIGDFKDLELHEMKRNY
ncbi:hypothetical protein [Brumimicrobium mesophilum]|uniref:hypothetical protein n=1 Tax=Brumimicrobium mesophilum TaxID=392717 RepID=UPI000D144570|nr:hypothetical protein [Brumimicrobium mesophilum]